MKIYKITEAVENEPVESFEKEVMPMKDYSELVIRICESIQENCGDASEAEELLRSSLEALDSNNEALTRAVQNLSRWKVKAQIILLRSREEILSLYHSGGWKAEDLDAISNPIIEAIDSIVKRKHPKQYRKEA